jgi:hypothetical protein
MIKSDSQTDPNKFPSPQDFNQGNKIFLPSKINTKHEKTGKGMEMLPYFQALSDDARKEILENLHQDMDKEDYVKKSKRTPMFFSPQMQASLILRKPSSTTCSCKKNARLKLP